MKSLAALVEEYEATEAKLHAIGAQIRARIPVEAPAGRPRSPRAPAAPAGGRARRGERMAVVLALGKKHPVLTAAMVAEACNVTIVQADAQLRSMVNRNKLVKVGPGAWAVGTWTKGRRELEAGNST